MVDVLLIQALMKAVRYDALCYSATSISFPRWGRVRSWLTSSRPAAVPVVR